jgi:hypothetical protein
MCRFAEHSNVIESPGPMPGFPTQMTRRGFVGAVAAGALATRAGAATVPDRATSAAAFLTRPDLTPPPLTISTPANGTNAGFVFLAPYDITGTAPVPGKYGPMILDENGQLVWYLPRKALTAMDLKVQKFRGQRVLTWYEGDVLSGYGGRYHIYDNTYHEIARVSAGNGFSGDLHEFLITSRDTALIAIYGQVTSNLTAVGGSATGQLVIGIVQEIEIPSGRVLFQWSSFDHVPVTESNMTQVTTFGNVDYFHLNSIGVDLDGDLLISARHTSTVYKVDRKTGAIKWRLGGKRSDFRFLPGAAFNFQHDVRRHADGTLTIFDNGAFAPGQTVEPFTRPIRLSLDMNAMTATLVEEYLPAAPRVSWAMGNVQQLPDDGVFVGWGTAGAFTEFDAAGGVRFDASFTDASISYRAFRSPWTAKPTGHPAVVVAPSPNGTLLVYASWNGATEVDAWQVRGGTNPAALKELRTVPRTGFETAIPIPRATGHVVVAALAVSGKQLAVSAPVTI